ncbi:uncharacterized protein LOC21409630 isoform X3 [Morus notabilis]|uniref:uncharacterized protein LOC21409630 isoform X3 n=1 Tax=Morus notabilis TaxID=981085 RepID=UPI000CED1749|nr:uncharacterized protein LOC21409630 isoform X3 [Morus notabilis]
MNMGFVPPGEGVLAGTGDRESCCNGGPHHGRLMSRAQGGRAAVMRGGCGMLRTPPGTKWVGKGRDCFLGRQSLCKDFVRVWVDVAKKPDAFLWRPTSDMSTIEEAISSNVAWPANKILKG